MMTENMKKMSLLSVAALMAGSLFAAPAANTSAAPAAAPAVAAAAADDTLVVFTERGSRANRYAPSGWMGDFGDLKMNAGWVREDKKDSKENTCIQIKYSAERKQGAGWAGIYWQNPANNWGDKKGGFDLTKYTKLTFWARGEKGGETVEKFFMGGITGQTEEGDSDEAAVTKIKLTPEWKQYTVDLKGLDLSHIIGGFGFAVSADSNPSGLTMYIDEIRYEK